MQRMPRDSFRDMSLSKVVTHLTAATKRNVLGVLKGHGQKMKTGNGE
jgi:hypothetical protein